MCMKKLFCSLILLMMALSITAQNLYFPPTDGSSTWETMPAEDLGWCADSIEALYQYLDTANSKAFLVLKDGKMVLEKYFDDFTRDSFWYWASAGKTMTASLVGIAQEQGYMNVSQPTSDFLGQGWTTAPSEKEDSITIWHQLTMTSGLDESIFECTDPQCLQYVADAGTRWAYHNGPYTLLTNLLETATGIPINSFYQSEVGSKIGAPGFYLPLGFNRLFFSTPRSMARFGLMILNEGVWNKDTIIKDNVYLEAMISPSQDLNPSYGYLWWLNGQDGFVTPGPPIPVPGKLVPTAPDDLFAGMGANEQRVYVIPSENMVVVRMGESTGTDALAISSFDRDLWEIMSSLSCTVTGTSSLPNSQPFELEVFPNPVSSTITLALPSTKEPLYLHFYNTMGQLVESLPAIPGAVSVSTTVNEWPQGMYWVRAIDKQGKLKGVCRIWVR